MTDLQNIQIGFLGAGQMATALAAGLTCRLLRPDQVVAVDPSGEARQKFQAAIGDDAVTADSAAALKNADVVFLAVKPHIMAAALASAVDHISDDALVVSIAAGLTIDRLNTLLRPGTRLIRVMPNTPCLVRRGACGLSASETATEDDVRLACQLLETVGVVEVVPEPLLDAVTGLSGSGPAYIYQIIEALSDGGVRMGLPRATSTRLAAQTVAGAAEMVLVRNEHPGALKDAVTSPGGTTIAALHALESGGVRAAMMNAVQVATQRAKELGQSPE